MPAHEPIYPAEPALGVLLEQLCAELSGEEACPREVRPAVLQTCLFELPVISSCFTGLFLALTLRLPGLAKWGWATGFAGIMLAAMCGALRFLLVGIGADASAAVNAHQTATFLAEFFSLWGFGLGAVGIMHSPFAQTVKKNVVVVLLVVLAVALVAIAVETPMVSHVPIILLILAGGWSQRQSLRGIAMILGVVCMAVAPEAGKAGTSMLLGFSDVDVIHLFLSAGLLCFAATLSLSPAAGSREGKKGQ
uniref:Uncharacterized protein n=1 Tax=Rhizochromulina marina TaxID=1034831 RepID=A0A7S2R5X8_9STRA|mmetsp:Transcript_11440/g.32924  ORF Transcript_11440/g.32924 Transcript_11440/m.32924 type:complete len:250 (+) Transcript_11440:55-804(+)